MIRLFVIILFVFASNLVLAQKLRRAVFYLDGRQINYKSFKSILKNKKFEQINTIPGTQEAVEIFGHGAKNGVVHLKTTKFILQQDSLIASFKKELKENGTETETIIINGVPFERNRDLDQLIITMDNKIIEWIFVPKNTHIFYPNKKIKVIQTNKPVEITRH